MRTGKWIMGCGMLLAVTVSLQAADITWVAGGSDTNWSTKANWSDGVNGVQTGDNVTFTDDGTVDGTDDVTSEVDASITVNHLRYNNIYVNVGDADSDGYIEPGEQNHLTHWHHTRIGDGVTLRVEGDFVVGSDDRPVGFEGDVDTYVEISGTGKLVVDNATEFTVDPVTRRFSAGEVTRLDMSELAELDVTTAVFLGVNSGGTDGYVDLPPSATITADFLGLGGWGNQSYLRFGQNSVLNVDSLQPGGAVAHTVGQYQGTAVMQFQAGLTDPTLTIRGRAGGTSRASMIVGRNATIGMNTADVDFSGGELDARFQDLSVLEAGYNNSYGYANGTGTFTFDRGTVDVVTLAVAKGSTAMRVDKNADAYGVLNIGTSASSTGILSVEELLVGDNDSGLTTLNPGPGEQAVEVYATVNLKGGTIRACDIRRGDGTDPDSTRTFNWYSGTIANETGSNLIFTAGIDVYLLSGAEHIFDIEAGLTGSVSSVIAETGGTTNGIIKTGEGTLVLNTNFTYTGVTEVREGRLHVLETVLSVAEARTAIGAGDIIGSRPTDIGAYTEIFPVPRGTLISIR